MSVATSPGPSRPPTSRGLALRILPVLGAGRAHTLMYRNYLGVRRHPWVFFGGFLEPVFYLFSLGSGWARWLAR